MRGSIPLAFLTALSFVSGYATVAGAKDSAPLIEEGDPTRFLILGDTVSAEEAKRYSEQYNAAVRVVTSPASASVAPDEVSPASIPTVMYPGPGIAYGLQKPDDQ